MTITKEQLAEIRERCEKATRGPLGNCGKWSDNCTSTEIHNCIIEGESEDDRLHIATAHECLGYMDMVAVQEFIIGSVSDVPRLLDEVERLLVIVNAQSIAMTEEERRRVHVLRCADVLSCRSRK